jgi:transcriptional regulator GlxA family with amidase domain
MCQNFSAYYTLEQLAEKFGMSLTSLKQGFRAVYGLPPASFMREFRIQQAAHLLRTTDDSVLSVASQVGYDNASKFAAAFHAIMKRNPAEYRRISS